MAEHCGVAAVIIGRNEGERLVACLASLAGQAAPIVYVDSGSTDGSTDVARARGAEVVTLDTALPFTAARARNAGAEHLAAHEELPEFIQFTDGDCVLDAGWIDTALAAFRSDPDLAVVCGRRREMQPGASLYNRMIDLEWDTPVGDARSCGGDALMRWRAFREAGGFDPTVIAGEEPELCVRLRQAGWRIRRLDAEMTRHDAAITRFGQWWRRAQRAGYAYALGAARHGAPPERHYVPELRRALGWGLALPLAVLLGVLISPWAWLGLALYPAQILRLAARDADLPRAALLVVTKFAEASGALRYAFDRASGRAARIIEYK
ncbi:MAG: glycosyltransferase family 2 protein [Pseudomonadota bacterium]